MMGPVVGLEGRHMPYYERERGMISFGRTGGKETTDLRTFLHFIDILGYLSCSDLKRISEVSTFGYTGEVE